MDFMDFSRRLYRWASEGVDMYDKSAHYVGVTVWSEPTDPKGHRWPHQLQEIIEFRNFLAATQKLVLPIL